MNEIPVLSALHSAYARYARYTNLDQMLPSASDGFLSIQRAAILAAFELDKGKREVKYPSLVAKMMEKYRNQGDEPSYGAASKLSMDYLPYSIIQGIGNFGSPTTRKIAAYRYTGFRPSAFGRAICITPFNDYAPIVLNELDYEVPSFVPMTVPYNLLSLNVSIGTGIQANTLPWNLWEVIQLIRSIINGIEPTDAVQQNISHPDMYWGGEVYMDPSVIINGEGQISTYPILEIGTRSITASNYAPQELLATIIKIKEAFERYDIKYDDIEDYSDRIIVHGIKEADKINVAKILRSRLGNVIRSYLAYIDTDNNLTSSPLGEYVSMWLENLLQYVPEHVLVSKLEGLEKFATPHKTTRIRSKYITAIDKVESIEEKVMVVSITLQGIVCVKERNGKTWSPKGKDTVVYQKVVKSTASLKVIRSNGSSQTITVHSLINKAENGAHIKDMCGDTALFLYVEADPATIVYQTDKTLLLYRGYTCKTGIPIRCVYHTSTLPQLFISDSGQFVITADNTYKYVLSGTTVRVMGEVPNNSKLTITQRGGKAPVTISINSLAYGQIGVLPVPAPFVNIEMT